MKTKSDLFEQIGGLETCERLSHLFHEKVERDDQLRGMFPKGMGALADRLALFLAEHLGGPALYTAKRGKQSLVCRHAHLPIGSDAASRWLEHMSQSMAEVGIDPVTRKRLLDSFTETARTLADPFLAFYDLPLNDLKERLKQEPTLATTYDLGRSLLAKAAGRWDVPRVRLLLEHGANANAETPKEHGPLYYAANAFLRKAEEDGLSVVELLIRYGAVVDHPSGPVRCTPLHMTARRGHIPLAKALLDAGANIESKDSKGETPLRRAVNCGHEEMVAYLMSRGADVLSQDKLGSTPLGVARKPSIREALNASTYFSSP